jgi:hypothetical protein
MLVGFAKQTASRLLLSSETPCPLLSSFLMLVLLILFRVIRFTLVVLGRQLYPLASYLDGQLYYDAAQRLQSNLNLHLLYSCFSYDLISKIHI